MVICWARVSVRHHEGTEREVTARAMTSPMQAQTRPSRRGSTSAAQPIAVSHSALIGPVAISSSLRWTMSPVHSATAPALAIEDGFTVPNVDHAIGVMPSRRPAPTVELRAADRASDHPTSRAATAPPPRRAHQIGSSPGSSVGAPTRRCPQMGYSPARVGRSTVSPVRSGVIAHDAATVGWKA